MNQIKVVLLSSCIASGYVVGVSDFLMLSLARLTVMVGKGVVNTVAESEVGHMLCLGHGSMSIAL